MKTVQISVERNFHILNDDRFIMEKISQTIQLDDMDDVQRAMDVARLEITNNFKAAYPKVEDSLNFHVVRQMKPDYNELNWYGLKDNAPIHEGGKKLCKLPTDAEFDERNDNLNLPTTIPEKTNKGTIAQSDFYTQEDAVENIKKEIASVKFKGILEKVYAPMIKNYPQLQELYNDKLKELQQK